jgi:hypothetical protein
MTNYTDMARRLMIPVAMKKRGINDIVGTEGARMGGVVGGGRYRIIGTSQDGSKRVMPNTQSRSPEYDSESKAKAQRAKLEHKESRGGRPAQYWEKYHIEKIDE